MRVRGIALLGLFAAVEADLGADAVARVRAALPPDVRARLAAPIVASEMYSVEVVAAVHEAIRTELGGGDPAMNRRIGALAARADFGGLYRAFIRVADYATLLRATERAWHRYNSNGRVEWAHIGVGEATAMIQHVRGFTEPMWHAIAGRLEAVLVLGGATSAAVEIVEWSDRSVRFQLRWAP